MAALQKSALSSMDPNLPTRPLARKRSARATNPSPLRKQSDYQLVAPLKTAPTVASGPPPAPSSTANQKQLGDPKTPRVAAKDRKKKLLCATPPQVLQDTRGRAEYDRGRQLGEGGFARCFLVQNKEGELFAAKTVAKKSLQNQRMKAKFFGEIQVHKTMIHPNVVKFVECFEDSDNIYMILELCPNKSLMDMLRARKRFTEPETRFFLFQLLGALKYMHGKKVIHRDLKLGNIFLDADMNVKIGDFGLAALLINENDRKRTICGTPNYIAPEVLFGSGKEGQGHSFEVDLWGVGVIMYAMLVGKPPFQAGDVNVIYQKIRHNTFSWPEEVPVSSAAKHLVHSILNHDPDARPTLDDIADHYFFKSGFFPRSIPVSAGKQPPSLVSARSSSQQSSQPSSQSSSQPSEGPIIPFGPNLSSKIGVPIRSTATSTVLSSLRSFINSLEAFASSRLHTLSPIPAATIAAVKSSRRGESNKHVFITKWVDYTNKYGVAYILTDGTCTAMFNDNTSFVVDSISGERVEFITQSYISDSSQDTVYRRLQTKMEVLNEKKRTSKGLARKMQMWKRFKNYMKSDLETVEQWCVERDSVIREPTVGGGDDPGMLFVTHYTRLKRCALFRFSDGSFQVCCSNSQYLPLANFPTPS
ncbi:kinase-like domain-containing protein [Tuber indicum]|nr:kinase-like domain-containing protein [Tuber indicum]